MSGERSVHIRAEGPEDDAPIASLVAAAFGSETEVRLVEAIRRGAGYVPELALIAEVDGQVVGFGFEPAAGAGITVDLPWVQCGPLVHLFLGRLALPLDVG